MGMAGGSRAGSGRKKMPESQKKQLKTFHIDRDLYEWLNNSYGRHSHSLVRKLLREQFDKENS